LDDTKSHYFSDALIRSGIYIDGKFKRGDYEAIVKFSRTEIGFVYFGDSVLPDKRTELLGKPQTDEQVEKTSTNIFINTKLVCRTCEKKFNPIETHFVDHVYKKILDSKNATDKKFEFNEYLYWITFVMFLINIWRASVSKFKGWHINSIVENDIRNYLFKILKSDKHGEIIELAKKNQAEVSNIKFQLLITEQREGKLSENLIDTTSDSKPYTIYLNRLVILFSDNNFTDFNIPEYLKGIVNKDQIEKSQNAYPKMIINQLNNSQRRKIIFSHFDKIWKRWVNDAENDLSIAIQNSFKRKMKIRELKLFTQIWQNKLANKEKASPELLRLSVAQAMKIITSR